MRTVLAGMQKYLESQGVKSFSSIGEEVNPDRHDVMTQAPGSLTYIVLFLLVTWYMYSDDRAFDGPLTLGFPLPFYYGGGFCMVPC